MNRPPDPHALPAGRYRPDRPLYLRIGGWDADRPSSSNYATGEGEAGLSVYAVTHGRIEVPTESEWAETDLRERLASDEPHLLVQGDHVGTGGDGEPLLGDPVVVGRADHVRSPDDRIRPPQRPHR